VVVSVLVGYVFVAAAWWSGRWLRGVSHLRFLVHLFRQPI
jgi:hypothetical protein